jgi:3-hydroxyacyl-[acyl-carrier-protein] dehydratase
LLINNLYTVQSFQHAENEIQVAANLLTDHDIFKGHFPGHPVLPGVCMMEMVVEMTGMHLKNAFRIKGSPLIKFLRMIDPRRNPIIDFEIKYQLTPGSVITNGRIFSGTEVFMKFQLNLVSDTGQ